MSRVMSLWQSMLLRLVLSKSALVYVTSSVWESWASPKTGRGLDHVRGGLAPVPAVPK